MVVHRGFLVVLFPLLIIALGTIPRLSDDAVSQPLAGDSRTAMELLNSGDEEGAFRLMSRLAAEGDASAQSNLGVMYQRGIATEVNFEKAFRLFKSAAAQSHPYAQFNLAEMYERGDYVEQDLDRAMTLYERAMSNEFTDQKVVAASMAAIIRIQDNESPVGKAGEV